MSRLLLLNKPYGVLCQFRDPGGRPVLADFVDVPGVYPAGRLDHDSEGLLLLTDDGVLQARIADPRWKLAKTYWVQVEGEISDEALARLAAGVMLNDGPTLPAEAVRLPPPALWERNPPVRYRASIPTSWIALTIREGRNRQVRRMTAAVGFPTLRLVRVAIGPWSLEGLAPGQWRELAADRWTLPVPADGLGPARTPAVPGTRTGAPAGGQSGRKGSDAGAAQGEAGGRPGQPRPAAPKQRKDERPVRRGNRDGAPAGDGARDDHRPRRSRPGERPRRP